MGVGPDWNKFKGTEYNISHSSVFETSTGGSPKQFVSANKTEMEFHNYVGYKAYFNFIFKDPMIDQEIFLAVWNSNATDLSLYNNWTFPNMYIWDDFYYATTSTKLLTTDYFKIGNESLMSTQFDVKIFKQEKL